MVAQTIFGVLGAFHSRSKSGEDHPFVAKQWFADITQEMNGYPAGRQSVYHDGVNARYRVINEQPMPLFHLNDTLHMDTVVINTTGLNYNLTIGSGDNAVCDAMTASSADPYAALYIGLQNKTGTSVRSGKPCDIWVGNGTYWNYQTKISVCLGEEGVPFEMNQTMYIGDRAASSTRQVWSNIDVGPIAESTFLPSKACATNYPTKACVVPEDAEKSKVLDLYRIHSPTEPLSLVNRNIGDALGDMAFTCQTGGAGFSADTDNVVSRWSVEVSPDYGQYSHCLYDRVHHANVCVDNSGMKVGRESAEAFGSGALAGQCTPNLDVGSWYSLPAKGQCPEGQPLGTNGCTWANARRLRTVNVSCVMQDRGLVASCKSEYGHAPFTKSMEIFKLALASADPQKGGCPDAFPNEVIFA